MGQGIVWVTWAGDLLNFANDAFFIEGVKNMDIWSRNLFRIYWCLSSVSIMIWLINIDFDFLLRATKRLRAGRRWAFLLDWLEWQSFHVLPDRCLYSRSRIGSL